MQSLTLKRKGAETMENGYSLSDLAAVSNGEGFGGNNIVTLLLLFALIGGNGLFGGGRNYYGEYATAASQNEILSGQKFDAVQRSINQVGDGLCSSTYALNNAITGEGRALQTQLSESTASINATTVNQTQKILDAMAQNKIDSLQSQVNTLTNQLALQNATCGTPKISPYMYNVVPNCCGCGNV